MTKSTVTVVGAGPYGLAAAAHLRHASVETWVFGDAMAFWRQQMPDGMRLRSSWEASHISDPCRTLTLDRYQLEGSRRLPRPIPICDFRAYGTWFQQQTVPDLDQRQVSRIEARPGGFAVTLDDGDVHYSARVVVAIGLRGFAYRPADFGNLPRELASHSSDHQDLARFRGMRVAVLGGGQSAIETAALLSEHGADVEVIMRARRVRWLRRSSWLHRNTGLFRYLLYPATDVGPPGLNQIVAHPELYRLLPPELQRWVAYKCIRPAAAEWLQTRVDRVKMSTGRAIESAAPWRDRLLLKLDDGSNRTIDHLICATGFRIDVERLPLLSTSIRRALSGDGGYPRLREGFESAVGGLHFLGAVSSVSFGPVMRFVSGTRFAARDLTRHVVAN